MSPRWRRLAAGVTAVTVSAGGYAAWSASAEADTAYRTTTVSRGSVTSTLQLSGTLGSGDRADLAFGTAGTVSEVLASVGDRLTAGQVIARLDQTDLRSAVTRARADLAAARDQLQQDQDAQSDTVAAATTSVSSPTSSSTGASGGSGATPGGSGQAAEGLGSSEVPESSGTAEPAAESLPTPDPEASSGDPDPDPALDQALGEALAALAAQQEAVTSAQSVASAALAEASSALEAQTAVCAAAFTSTDPEPEGEPGGDTTGDEPAGDATSSADDACTTALATVQAAQASVAEAQDALQSALTTLADTLTAAVATLTDAASATGGEPEDQAVPNDDQGEDSASAQPSQDAQGDEGQSSQNQTSQSQNSQSQNSQSQNSQEPVVETQGTAAQGSETVTAATLARDQADIDTARADLVAAKMALTGSTLRAPHAGRLLALEAGEGDSIGAGSDVGVLVAGGLSTVSLSVTTDQVADLAIGQSADVTPVGATAALPGEVTSVAAVPTTSTTGDSTYAVVVTLDERGLDLPEGAGAAVAVTTDEVSDALTVPASALTSGVVRVLAGDTLSRARVTTGLIGSGVVEVVDGVEEGEQVVLADLDAAVPTGDSDATTPGQGGFGGGFGGGVPGGGVGPGAGGFGGGAVRG